MFIGLVQIAYNFIWMVLKTSKLCYFYVKKEQQKMQNLNFQDKT